MMSVIEELYKLCVTLESDEAMNDIKEEIIKGKDFLNRVEGLEKKFDGYNLFFFKTFVIVTVNFDLAIFFNY